MTASRFDVRVDRAVCMGNGTCTYHAPATFDIDDENKVVLLATRDADEHIVAAADGCPTRAITLIPNPGVPRP